MRRHLALLGVGERALVLRTCRRSGRPSCASRRPRGWRRRGVSTRGLDACRAAPSRPACRRGWRSVWMSFGPTRTAARRRPPATSPPRRRDRLRRSSRGEAGARSCRRAPKGTALFTLSEATHSVRAGRHEDARARPSARRPPPTANDGSSAKAGLPAAVQPVERGDAVERARRPLARREAVADLLELLHGLARLAQEGQRLAHLELRGRGGLAGRVLEGDAARGLRGLGEPARLAVDEAGGVAGRAAPTRCAGTGAARGRTGRARRRARRGGGRALQGQPARGSSRRRARRRSAGSAWRPARRPRAPCRRRRPPRGGSGRSRAGRRPRSRCSGSR